MATSIAKMVANRDASVTNLLTLSPEKPVSNGSEVK